MQLKMYKIQPKIGRTQPVEIVYFPYRKGDLYEFKRQFKKD